MRCGSSASGVLDAERTALLARRRFAPLERFGCAALELGRDVLVEALDLRDLLDRHVGDFLEAGETLRDEQLREGFVDVELRLEERRALDEFALALFARVGFGQDVDLRGGELAREPHVLAAAADGEAQLVVGDDDLDPALFLVDDDAADCRRLEPIDDEGRQILRSRG